MASGDRINGWNDGLKFLGRVKSVSKTLQVGADGVVSSQYTVSCEAFGEFDSVVMYYPQMKRGGGVPDQMEKFGVEVGKLIRGEGESADKGAVDINKLIPAFMKVIFGQGAWAGTTFRDGAIAPNTAYLVPQTVMKWLGNDEGYTTFADFMRLLMGVQKYSKSANKSNETGATAGSLFWPDGAVSKSNGAFVCPIELKGTFPFNTVPQTQTTAWSFFTTYLNPPINETMVNLRVDDTGFIYPFFTIRQCPYTSEVGHGLEEAVAASGVTKGNEKVPMGPPTPDEYAQAFPTRFPVTRFLELPRWVVPSSLLRSATISRDDANRYNLVFVYGSGPGVPFNETLQFVTAGPVSDNSLSYDDFRNFMADIVIGQHLTLNGNLTFSGIQAPIAPGDNCEYNGVVYHIEGLTHNYVIDPKTGMRDFNTSINVSRGVLVSSSEDRETAFAGVSEDAPAQENLDVPTTFEED
jgi:hypothetical protein